MPALTHEEYFSAAIAARRGYRSDHNPAEIRVRAVLAERQGRACPFCGQVITPEDIGGGLTHKDHVIPLSRGWAGRGLEPPVAARPLQQQEAHQHDGGGVGARG